MLYVVQSLSHVLFFVTPWTAACQASLSFTISQILLKFMSIELVMLSNHLVLCCLLLLLPSVFASTRVFANESALQTRWPKYWNFSFSFKISTSNEYSVLISFTIQFSCSIMSSSFATPCMDCSMPGFPVLHQLPELAQTHVHQVGDTIQPFHSLLSPFPPVFNLSQHQGLLQWVSSSHQVAKVLDFSFNISPSNEYSGLISFRMGLVGSPCSPKDSQESSPTPQLKSINSSVLCFLYNPNLTSIHDHWKNYSLD